MESLISQESLAKTHSETGQIVYYIPQRWTPKKEHNFPLLYWHCREIQYQLQQIAKKYPAESVLLGKFITLVKNRSKIFSTEIKRKYEPSTTLLDRDISYLMSYFTKKNYSVKLGFWNNPAHISKPLTKRELGRYADMNLRLSRILLDHQIHATGFYFHLYKKFKFTNYRRSTEEKLSMKHSDNHIEWGLRRQKFQNTINTINKGRETGQDDEFVKKFDGLGGMTDYNKVINNLGAENQTSIYKNKEFLVYSYMIEMINRDLEYLRSLPLSEREYGEEFRDLSLWWDLILCIAVKRMENNLSGNYVMADVDGLKGNKIPHRFINDVTDFDDMEMEDKKNLMFLALSAEL